MVLCAGRRHEDALLELGCSHNDLPIGVSIQPPLFSVYKGTTVKGPSIYHIFLVNNPLVHPNHVCGK